MQRGGFRPSVSYEGDSREKARGEPPVQGVFDGQGYTIKNLTIDLPDHSNVEARPFRSIACKNLKDQETCCPRRKPGGYFGHQFRRCSPVHSQKARSKGP